MIRGFALSTRGNNKRVNDDKVILGRAAICAGTISSKIEGPTIAAVLDGVSQGGRGSEASNIAASLIIEHLCSAEHEVTSEDITALLQNINYELLSHQNSEKNPDPIATTISGLAIGDNSKIVGFNSGDSRIYRFRNGMLVQMTTDHTLTQSLIDSGADDYLIDQAENTNAHTITKALGIQDKSGIVADVEEFGELIDGDIFIGCTDGLSGFLSRDDIKRVLSAGVDLTIMGKTLVDMALHNGSYDNISLFMLVKNPAIAAKTNNK